jgi:hypothetical protein
VVNHGHARSTLDLAPTKFEASNIRAKHPIHHGGGVRNSHYEGEEGFCQGTVNRLLTSPIPESLDNKYSILSIDETNDIKDNDNHKKGVEVSKTPISPKYILIRPEKMAENFESNEKKNKKTKELQVAPCL